MNWQTIPYSILFAVIFVPAISAVKIFSKKGGVPKRPDLIKDAIANGDPLYYFGLGSNMSRKKVENRGLNGTKIELQDMKAAYVPNYRLAFNMKGFPPLEPGMGSLEPVNSATKALLAYEHEECHGALIKLTPENYEKVMRSEGVGFGHADQAYEEIIVDAFPYEQPDNPVKAVALRARDHARLDFDPRPSARYMSILREGAKELGLRPCYQEFLESHPVQMLPLWQKKEAVFNIMFLFTISSLLKWRGFSKFQSRLLFLFYSHDSSSKISNIFSTTMTTIVLLPGALVGYVMYSAMQLTGKTPDAVKKLIATFEI